MKKCFERFPAAERRSFRIEPKRIDDTTEVKPELNRFQVRTDIFPGGEEGRAVRAEVCAKFTDLSGLACQLMRLPIKVQPLVSVPGDQCDFYAILLSVFENEKSRLSFLSHQSAERKKYMILFFDYSADWAETEYPDTESLQLESGKPSVFRPVRAFKMGPVAVQFRVKSEISRIASMKIDHFRTFFRARFLPKMADLRHRKDKIPRRNSGFSAIASK